MNFEQIKKIARAVASAFPYKKNQGLGFVISENDESIVVFENYFDKRLATYGMMNSSLKNYWNFPKNGEITKFEGQTPDGQRVFFSEFNRMFQIGYDSQKPEKHNL